MSPSHIVACTHPMDACVLKDDEASLNIVGTHNNHNCTYNKRRCFSFRVYSAAIPFVSLCHCVSLFLHIPFSQLSKTQASHFSRSFRLWWTTSTRTKVLAVPTILVSSSELEQRNEKRAKPQRRQQYHHHVDHGKHAGAQTAFETSRCSTHCGTGTAQFASSQGLCLV